MSEVKDLVDQYAAENQALKIQAEQLLVMVRDLTVMYMNDKGEVRVTGKVRTQADKYGLEIKQLKTSIVLKVKEKMKE